MKPTCKRKIISNHKANLKGWAVPAIKEKPVANDNMTNLPKSPKEMGKKTSTAE